MLRVILWKIGCEWAHLKRAFWPRLDRKTYYFAFGANLCRDVLELRRIRIFDEFDFALENAELRFSQPGFYRQHGYASADAADGKVVCGKMYLILERDAERMDYFEGVPFLRAHEKVYRETAGFEFYFYRTTRVVEGLKPTREYLDYIVDAYRQMPIVPATHLALLRDTEVLERYLPMDETGLFISDIGRWPALLHPLLIRYERLCSGVVEVVWHRSPLQWLIRV